MTERDISSFRATWADRGQLFRCYANGSAVSCAAAGPLIRRSCGRLRTSRDSLVRLDAGCHGPMARHLPDVAAMLQQSREIYVTLNTRREHADAGAEDLFRPGG